VYTSYYKTTPAKFSAIILRQYRNNIPWYIRVYIALNAVYNTPYIYYYSGAVAEPISRTLLLYGARCVSSWLRTNSRRRDTSCSAHYACSACVYRRVLQRRYNIIHAAFPYPHKLHFCTRPVAARRPQSCDSYTYHNNIMYVWKKKGIIHSSRDAYNRLYLKNERRTTLRI